MVKNRLRWVVIGVLASLALIASGLAAVFLARSPAGGSPAGVALASTAETMTPSEVEAVERVVRDYLMRNPDVILEALRALEARGAEQVAAAQRRTIAERRDELLNDPAAPAAGNPDGAVTVVEFFDYQCPYCKRVAGDLVEMLRTESDVRVVFKEYPILGPVSEFAAKAALAAHRQGKYLDFHLALMSAKGKLTEQAVLDLAAQSGLDVGRLRGDMEAPEIAEALRRNHALAGALRVEGTPAFVIGDQVVPGAIDKDQMRAFLDAARSS